MHFLSFDVDVTSWQGHPHCSAHNFEDHQLQYYFQWHLAVMRQQATVFIYTSLERGRISLFDGSVCWWSCQLQKILQ